MRDARALRMTLLAGAILLVTTTATAVPPPRVVPDAAEVRAARHRVLSEVLGHFGARDLNAVPCRSVSGGPGAGPTVNECPRPNAAAQAPAEESPAGPGFEETAVIVTPTGLMAPVGLPAGGPGAYARVYQNGDIAVDDATGEQVWSRSGVQFVNDSGVGLPNPSVAPRIWFGFDPADPTTPLGEDTYAVADLTGDGAADLAVAHFVRPGTRQPDARSALVSVLDGRTGDVVWKHLYPGYVGNLAIVGDTLVIGNQTGNPLNLAGEAGSVSALHAWRFEASGKRVTAVPAWSVPATEWARFPAMQQLDGNRLAVAWSDAPLGAEGDVVGRVLVVDVASGTVVWDAPAAGHPRVLRHDPVRDTVVALEQDDPLASDRPGYSLVARSATSGTQAGAFRSDDSLPLAVEVADVTGGAPEWLVNDVTLLPTGACAAVPLEELPIEICTGATPVTGRVRVVDPASGGVVWTQERGAEQEAAVPHALAPQPFGLRVLDTASGPLVLVASLTSTLANTELAAYDGKTGTARWVRREPNTIVPLFLSVTAHGGRTALLAAASRTNVYGTNVAYEGDGVNHGLARHVEPYQVVSAYAADDGSVLARNPVIGDIYAATRVDAGRRKDPNLVVGGESGAVFALDGKRLDGGKNGGHPPVLWRTTVSGQVRHLAAADLDGDTHEEIVVVASRSVEVLDGRTGVRRYVADYADDFVWTVALGDVDGDGLRDIVVPARGLTAYRGVDGRRLWQHQPLGVGDAYFGTSEVAGDGAVVSQYYVRPDAPVGKPTGADNQTVVAIDGKTGAVRWQAAHNEPIAVPALWRGLDVGRMAGVPGDVVAATWSTAGSGLGQHPRTDIYDLRTGTLVHSATAPISTGHRATLLMPGGGAEQANARMSLHVTPAGDTPNLEPITPTDVRLVPDASALLVAQWPSRLMLLDTAVVNGGRFTEHLLDSWGRGMSIGTTTIRTVEPGTSEVIAYPFDWGAYSGSQQPMGMFSFAVDIVPHALVVLAVRS